MKARLSVKEGAVPKFCKPWIVPLAIHIKITDELDNMVKCGISYSLEWSDCAARIIPILLSDGSVRIGKDFKVTVNPHLNVDSFFQPLTLCQIPQGKFTKIDRKSPHLQMEVEIDSVCALIYPRNYLYLIVWHAVLPRLQPFARKHWFKFLRESITSRSF